MIHVPDEILDFSPVFLHNMYPFERYNRIVKRYIRNRSRPEGSIIQGYAAEECVEFCTDYMADQKPIGVPVSRNTGRLDGKGGLGRANLPVYAVNKRRSDDYDRAHFVVLQHLSIIRPYIDMHMKELKHKTPKKGPVALCKDHNTQFARWLKDYWYGREPIDEEEETVKMLSQEPDSNVVTFQSYDINGYTFYTEAQDRKSTYQNSGITMEATTVGRKSRYYGVIEEMWELDYTVTKIAMFRIRWAKDVKIDDDNFTTMTLPPSTPLHARQVKSISAREEPWVLAKQLSQVFYIRDPKNPKRHVMRK
jgi:hypothetical protein